MHSRLILQLIRSHGVSPSTDHRSAIDYFSTGQTTGVQISSKAQDGHAENDNREDCEMENADSVVSKKRKQKQVKADVKMKKKKPNRDKLDVDGTVAAVFLRTKTISRDLFASRQYWFIGKSTFKSIRYLYYSYNIG